MATAREEPQTTSRARGDGLYYGWVVAWTSFGVLTITYGVQFSFGVFLPSIARDLDVSRTQAAAAYSVYVLVYSIMSSVSGALTDRRGPRLVLAAGGVLFGIGYALTGAAQSTWQLIVALGLIAGLGMSAAFVPCNATVVRWFAHKRGRALSVSTSGGSFAAVVVPFLAGWLVERTSWRVLYLGCAVMLLVGLLVASRLLVGRPEDIGLTLEDELGRRGAAQPRPATADDGAGATGAGAEVSLTPRQAARTTSFWVLVSIFLCTWLVVFLPLVHLPPFAEDLGIGATVAASLVSAVGIGGLVGRTLTGGFSDRVGRTVSLAAVLGVQVVAFLVFAVSDSLWTLYPAAVGFGFGYGGTTTVFPALVADLFGRAHAGALTGLVFAGAGSAAAVGPFVAAWMYDLTGSYRAAFVLSAVVNGMGLVLVVVLRATTPAHPGGRAAEPSPLRGTGQLAPGRRR
ncbi:MAG: MFS transporter [Acidimicrobiia bacterium]|nr:MFS transporter [Acidimicrobiia bacterium]